MVCFTVSKVHEFLIIRSMRKRENSFLNPFLKNNPKSIAKVSIDVWVQGMIQNWKENQHTINVDPSKVIIKHSYILFVSREHG